jgi:hypothetical protein
MIESDEIANLRELLASPAPKRDIDKEWAIGGVTDVIDAMECGLWTLGDWERNCIAAAIIQIHAGNYASAQNFALKALLPATKRREGAIMRGVGAQELTLSDLKVRLEHARELADVGRRAKSVSRVRPRRVQS